MKFLSGFGALALAAVALATTFTSCEKESGNRTIKVNDAKATIVVSVTDETGSALSSTITASAGTVNGNKVELTGNQNISAQTVNVTVAVNDLSATAAVAIPAVEAGTEYNTTANFVVYENKVIVNVPGKTTIVTTDATYEFTPTESNSETERYYLTGDYNHSHNGVDMWISNATEYIKTVKVSYYQFSGFEVVGEPEILAEGELMKWFIEGLKTSKIVAEKVEMEPFEVSAWSLYAAWADNVTTTTTCLVEKVKTTTTEEDGTVTGTNEERTTLAKINVVTKSSTADHTEMAHPDHASHYQFGHGHSHSHGADYAGGGIANND